MVTTTIKSEVSCTQTYAYARGMFGSNFRLDINFLVGAFWFYSAPTGERLVGTLCSTRPLNPSKFSKRFYRVSFDIK
jgi:hypothetical protein